MPWLGKEVREVCKVESPRTVLRGASNLYFPLIRSALSIPDWDDPVHLAIAQHEEQLAKVDSVDKLMQGIQMGFLPKLAEFEAEADL